VVRRYREQPPLVRDAGGKWRTGRLDLVLGGEFDLLSGVA
jgi:ATP-dependent Clp protease ATP-binding subunit ClpC